MPTLIERFARSTEDTLRNRVKVVLYRVCLAQMSIAGSTAADKAKRAHARAVLASIDHHVDRITNLLTANIPDLANLENDAQIETLLNNNWGNLAGSADAS